MIMKRSGYRHLGTKFDTVASHSYHVAIIAYCIAKMENLSQEEVSSAVLMALFHDLPEARTGDNDLVMKNYSEQNEEKAIEDQIKGLPFADDLRDIFKEYTERTSKASKCAKDADAVDEIYQEWVLMWQGNKLAEEWLKVDLKHRASNLRTKSAKKIIDYMVKSNPMEWWWFDFVDDNNINLKHLNGK